MDSSRIKQLLPPIVTTYYFGSAGFALESRDTFEQCQVGYRKHPDGSDLTGVDDGDWQPAWYVVGRDTTVGDPFFVDVTSSALPVYTAMHGAGSWDPTLVSASFTGFMGSLEVLKNKSGQDIDLIDPDEHTIRDEGELEEIHSEIVRLCGTDSEFFWECFFEQHQDWIAESEDWDD